MKIRRSDFLTDAIIASFGTRLHPQKGHSGERILSAHCLVRNSLWGCGEGLDCFGNLSFKHETFSAHAPRELDKIVPYYRP